MPLPIDFIPAGTELPPEVKTALENPVLEGLINQYHQGLIANRDEVLSKLQLKKTELEELGGMETIRARIQELQDIKVQNQELTRLSKKTNQSVEEVRTEMQLLIQERDQKLKALEEKRVQAELHARLVQAIKEANGDPDLLLPFVQPRVLPKCTEEGDILFEIRSEDNKPLLKPNGDPAGFGELVQNFKANEKFSPLFKAENIGGSGARPGGGNNSLPVSNPFLKGDPNYGSVSAQSRLYRENRALCIQLAAQAGVKLE